MGHYWVMFGPYGDHIWPYFTSRPSRALELSSWSKTHFHAIITFWDYFSAMFEPYWNYIGPNYTSKPAKAPKFSRQSQYALRNIGMGCLFFG